MNYSLLNLKHWSFVVKSKPLTRASSGKTPATPENQTVNLQSMHKVNGLERKFLVWTKKYKSLQEVPNFVSQAVMEKTRNRMRIKIANYMMVATVFGCCLMVYLGKKDQREGKSVTQMNLDWHRQLKEEQDKKNAIEAQKN